MANTLTVQFEAQEPITVDLGKLRGQKSKTISDGLQGLLAAEFPHIARLLREGGGNFDLELSHPGEGGTPVEIPLTVDDDWERNVVAACEKTGTAELAIAEHIFGGSSGLPETAERWQASGRNLISLSAARHPVMQHPAGYQLTEADKERVLEGGAIFITGRALTMACVLAQHFGGDEYLWYWAAAQANPYLITDVILPERQIVSSARVQSRGLSVIRCLREARAKGLVLVAAGHSHGADGAVWTSVVDLHTMGKLAASRYGWSSVVRKVALGQVEQKFSTDTTVKTYEVRFESSPPQPAGIRLKTAGHLPADLAVEFEWEDDRRDVTGFSTHNGRLDDLHLPVIVRTSCPRCGNAVKERIYRDPEIHIVGERVLTHAERNQLAAEAERKGVWSFSSQQRSYPADRWPTTAGTQILSQGSKPDDYTVTRHGRTWHIPAAVVEQAAAACPALAEAIFFEDHDEPVTGN